MKGAWLPGSSILFVSSIIILITQVGHCYGQLKQGFYQGKCGPTDIEKLIFNVVQQKFAQEPDTVSDLVRLSFHDCFVRVRTSIAA